MIRIKRAIFAVLIISSLLFSGCIIPTTTKTTKPKTYIYGVNEKIEIIGSGDEEILGTLTITGVEVLLDEDFLVEDTSATNSDQQKSTVTYRQLIQVFYQYESISASYDNFLVTDSEYESALGIDYINPRPDFKKIDKEGQKSFIVGLKNKSDYVEIDYRYVSVHATPTATIRIDL